MYMYVHVHVYTCTFIYMYMYPFLVHYASLNLHMQKFTKCANNGRNCSLCMYYMYTEVMYMYTKRCTIAVCTCIFM